MVRIVMTKYVTLNVKPDTHKAVLDLMSDLQRESDHLLSMDAVVARAVATCATSRKAAIKEG
ncbi:MAG: hypothetical protein WAL97_05190 [Halobacteriota archaeon]